MTFGKPQAIAPVPAQAGGYSLLVAAGFSTEETIPADDPEQSTPARWQGGVAWAPEQVQGGGAGTVDCLGATPDGLVADDTNPETNEAFPILLQAVDRCSTFQTPSRDREGRARRELEAVQSTFLAHEVQHGTIRDADSLDNVALVDGTVINPGSTDPLHVLAALEQVTATQYGGRRAMLHAAPALLTFLVSTHALIQSGQKWLTPMGNVVAADGGYTAEGATYFLYATLMPRIWLGNIVVVPDTLAQATHRQTNLVEYIAQRLALVAFDASNTDDADLIFKAATDVAVTIDAS